jgi:hypothetical protein
VSTGGGECAPLLPRPGSSCLDLNLHGDGRRSRPPHRSRRAAAATPSLPRLLPRRTSQRSRRGRRRRGRRRSTPAGLARADSGVGTGPSQSEGMVSSSVDTRARHLDNPVAPLIHQKCGNSGVRRQAKGNRQSVTSRTPECRTPGDRMPDSEKVRKQSHPSAASASPRSPRPSRRATRARKKCGNNPGRQDAGTGLVSCAPRRPVTAKSAKTISPLRVLRFPAIDASHLCLSRAERPHSYCLLPTLRPPTPPPAPSARGRARRGGG